MPCTTWCWHRRSDRSEALARVYPGPIGLLPIGVDTELFTRTAAEPDRFGVVSTVNQWGREREVFALLKEKEPDFPLALYGQQRGIAPQLEPYAHGPISFFALPSLYNQARIVLDDFNHTTAPYGNVNSRCSKQRHAERRCSPTVLSGSRRSVWATWVSSLRLRSSSP